MWPHRGNRSSLKSSNIVDQLLVQVKWLHILVIDWARIAKAAVFDTRMGVVNDTDAHDKWLKRLPRVTLEICDDEIVFTMPELCRRPLLDIQQGHYCFAESGASTCELETSGFHIELSDYDPC